MNQVELQTASTLVARSPSNKVFNSIPEIIQAIAAGEMVIMLDDAQRENEGDLIMAASLVKEADINFMARYGRGLICMPVSEQHAQQLQLKPMVQTNQTEYQTNFSVSIEAATGVTTGISCADRAQTIQVAANAQAQPHDLISPGHIFPLVAQKEGVLTRAGHTEASIDLVHLAKVGEGAVLVEILHENGTMARLPELKQLAKKHRLKIGRIADLIDYQKQHQSKQKLSQIQTKVSVWGGSEPISATPKLQVLPEHRIAIVASRFNNLVVDSLVTQAKQTLGRCGATTKQVDSYQVPGAYELGLAVQQVVQTQRYSGVVALGAVVKGETPHFDLIAGGCAQALEKIMLEANVPIGFGVITANTLEQAMDRAGGKAGNKGEEATLAMVEMLHFAQQLRN